MHSSLVGHTGHGGMRLATHRIPVDENSLSYLEPTVSFYQVPHNGMQDILQFNGS